MKSEIVPFSFDGAPVRTISPGGDPWFVHTDVCQVLGLGNSSQAAARLDDDEKGALLMIPLVGRSK